MKKKLIGLLVGIVALASIGKVDVKAVDYETALALQAASAQAYNDQLAQQQAAAAAVAAQQQAINDALAAQQAAIAEAQRQALEAQQAAITQAQKQLEAQQKAALEALAAQQAAAAEAQKQALEAATAIATASLTTPQLDVVCDTNCSEQNALLYAKCVPDFVLVDISEQRAISYKNGTRVLGDNCVTGDARKNYNTRVGIHQIIFMDNNRTLRGSYGEAFVKYWMRFTSDGQGLHDAGWRSRFGSGIYVSNGSHGCVNLPRETAATIFNNAYVGMFVIVEN